MAKDLGTKERFIELRAEGWSFSKIAEELGVSKPTLMKWQGKLDKEISFARFTRLETLAEQYSLMKHHRIQHFGELLNRLLEELRSRDLTEVPTDKLLKMVLTIEGKLRMELNHVRHEEGLFDNLDFSPNSVRID